MRGAPRLSVSPSASASCKNRSTTGWNGSTRARTRTRASERANERANDYEEVMLFHDVKVHASASALAREDQLAWKLAAVAADPVPLEPAVREMIVNRIIDNAGVAIAAINRHPVVSARAMALGHTNSDHSNDNHSKGKGATVIGGPSNQRVIPEWAAWANGTAVPELGMTDTLLAADFGHPGDNIPPIFAVAQPMKRSGADHARGIATASALPSN